MAKLLLTLISLDPIKNLKKDHKYNAQVHCQLFVCNFKKCDFVVWTLVWLHITELVRDVQCMTNILITLQNFYIPEYFARNSCTQGKLKTKLQKHLMDRKTNCTVSAIVDIHQTKLGLALTQKNVNGSVFIFHG